MIDLLIKKQELLEQLEDIQKQIDARPKISPVFSGDFGYSPHIKSKHRALDRWQEARVRIIEKINIVNNGDNGFEYGLDNFYFVLDKGEVCGRRGTVSQTMEPMFYIRTWTAAQELLKDPQFCEDMKTYFKGWL